jgi:hypothetical protein
MRTRRIVAALVLCLSCGIGAVACNQSTETSPETPQSTAAEDTATEATDDGDIAAEESALGESAYMPEDESTQEIHQNLGYENPLPGPGTLLPGGHDPGGPGYGWGRGWADDPQYAPYCRPRDPDPYKEQRHAKQREYDRIRAENRRHAGGRQNESDRVAHRRYPGGVLKAPDAPHAPQHGDGPLDDKARCLDECWYVFLVDSSRCRKLPYERRQACWQKAIDDLASCNRDCPRKYPTPH